MATSADLPKKVHSFLERYKKLWQKDFSESDVLDTGERPMLLPYGMPLWELEINAIWGGMYANFVTVEFFEN